MFIMIVSTHCTSFSSYFHALWVFRCRPQGGDNSPDIASFLFSPKHCVIRRGETSHLNHWAVWKKRPIRSKAGFWISVRFPRTNIWTTDCLLWSELCILQQLQTVRGHWLLLLKVGQGGLSSGFEISALYASCFKMDIKVVPSLLARRTSPDLSAPSQEIITELGALWF